MIVFSTRPFLQPLSTLMATNSSTAAHPSDAPWLDVFSSRYFPDWLRQERISLAFTTYQAGKLFMVGCKADPLAANPLSLFDRTFPHCMGMCASVDGQTLWFSSRYQIWRLERTSATAVPHRATGGAAGETEVAAEIPAWVGQGYDVTYIPRIGYTTGHIDAHDMALDADGKLVFVNTMFGCLATLSERANFKPLWRPTFLSALVPEDRCHLNGLAMRNGRPGFVTLAARSDVADGWRDKRRNGGCVLDVASGEAICTGLSMPHSPRWYREQLWLLNSGRGEFGRVDLATGRFEPITFCPGYLRGLTFHGDYAIVTLSKPREKSFQGLELDDRLLEKGAEPQCGLQVIDLRSGVVSDWLRVESGQIHELYDCVVLPGVRQPMALGFKTTEIERLMVIEQDL